MATVGLGIKDIKGSEDYKHYYHTDSSGNIWVDGKGLPIELAIPLHDQHVDTVSPESLWNGIQIRNQIHTDVSIPSFFANTHATSSTMINPEGAYSVPKMPFNNEPVSPIVNKTASNTKEDLADDRTLFNITYKLAQTVLQTTEKLVNDPKMPKAT